MEEEEQATGPARESVKEALGRFFPVITAGMPEGEAAKAREILGALFTLRSGKDPGGTRDEIARRLALATGLSLEGRRRILQEDALALEVEEVTREVSATAEQVFHGEVRITPALKKETRRRLARLGQLNAVLVGRFPHLTPLLQKVSESYLDAMFVLGDGKGPAGTRLQQMKKERESTGKQG